MDFSRSIKLLHLVPILRKYSAFLHSVCVLAISLSHCNNFTYTFVQEWKCPAVILSVQSPLCAVVMAAWTRDLHIKLHFFICRVLYPVSRSNIGWYKAERKGFSNSGFHRNIPIRSWVNAFKIHGLEQALCPSSTCVKNFPSALQQRSDQVCSKTSFSLIFLTNTYGIVPVNTAILTLMPCKATENFV